MTFEFLKSDIAFKSYAKKLTSTPNTMKLQSVGGLREDFRGAEAPTVYNYMLLGIDFDFFPHNF